MSIIDFPGAYVHDCSLGHIFIWQQPHVELRVLRIQPQDRSQPSSLRKSACLKYFIPTQATTTQTQAMTQVNTINAG